MTETASPWMTREEAAEYLRVKPRTVDRMVREGKLHRHRLQHGSHPRYLRREVYAQIMPDDGVGQHAPQVHKAAKASLVSRGKRPEAEAGTAPAAGSGSTAHPATGAAMPTDTVRQPRVSHE